MCKESLKTLDVRRFTLKAILILILALGCGTKGSAPEGMVLVPAGDFIMGTDETDPEDKAAEYGIMKPWLVDENPAHKVFLDAYYIDKYEVSNLDYKKFIDATVHRPPPYWQEGRYPEGDDKLPAVMVTWDDANSFCLWAGKRLPTEAEWEKGARGTDGRRFPWGNEFDNNRANVGATRSGPMPINDFEGGRSPYGIYQMIGNVWEWTYDWYKPYPGNKYNSDHFGEKFRVLRGNSFANVGHFPQEIHREVVARHSSATFRLFFRQDGSVGDIGFRCAKSIKK